MLLQIIKSNRLLKNLSAVQPNNVDHVSNLNILYVRNVLSVAEEFAFCNYNLTSPSQGTCKEVGSFVCATVTHNLKYEITRAEGTFQVAALRST